jgi:hypothetical protein
MRKSSPIFPRLGKGNIMEIITKNDYGNDYGNKYNNKYRVKNYILFKYKIIFVVRWLYNYKKLCLNCL